MGVGGRGKCPGAPSHHLKEGEDRQKKKRNWKGKTADRKGTVKAVWQKTGMAFKKKHVNSILSIHKISKASNTALRQLINDVNTNIEALKILKQATDKWDY
jgi:hypothetical protein